MKKYFVLIYPITLAFLCLLLPVFQKCTYADEVYLKNDDRISGEIIKDREDSITIDSEAMGPITINRKYIKHIITNGQAKEAKPEEQKKKLWQRKVSLGYNKSSGNTRDSQLTISFFANKKREHVDEFTLKGDVYYSSAKRKMDAQRYCGMVRYAFSFGKTKRWYNFYRLEADHDRFANVDYRIVPAAGAGYWFFDLIDIKVMAEAGIGLEHTDYRGQTKDRDEVIFTPRAFIEKKLFGNAKICQDLLLYPALDDFNQYRLHSETVFTNTITEKLSLRISLIDDYNSNPPKDTKKNDLRLISSLSYSF